MKNKARRLSIVCTVHEVKFDLCNQVLTFERLNMSVAYKDSVRTEQ
jgi:hypothetical protein